jgi:hypothetical protein
MSEISRETAGGRAYIDLQRRAKATRRNTQELIQLYILEGFLARLAASSVREKFVLKGGVLLAAFGNRRPTRDVDFAGRDIGNDEATILTLIKSKRRRLDAVDRHGPPHLSLLLVRRQHLGAIGRRFRSPAPRPAGTEERNGRLAP